MSLFWPKKAHLQKILRFFEVSRNRSTLETYHLHRHLKQLVQHETIAFLNLFLLLNLFLWFAAIGSVGATAAFRMFDIICSCCSLWCELRSHSFLIRTLTSVSLVMEIVLLFGLIVLELNRASAM